MNLEKSRKPSRRLKYNAKQDFLRRKHDFQSQQRSRFSEETTGHHQAETRCHHVRGDVQGGHHGGGDGRRRAAPDAKKAQTKAPRKSGAETRAAREQATDKRRKRGCTQRPRGRLSVRAGSQARPTRHAHGQMRTVSTEGRQHREPSSFHTSRDSPTRTRVSLTSDASGLESLH